MIKCLIWSDSLNYMESWVQFDFFLQTNFKTLCCWFIYTCSNIFAYTYNTYKDTIWCKPSKFIGFKIRHLISAFKLMSTNPEILRSDHRLIRGVLIQNCSAGAKTFTNYVFCHVQFSGVIQNIENRCAIRAKFWRN